MGKNAVNAVAEADMQVERGDQEDETGPVNPADHEAEQFVVLATRQDKTKENAQNRDRDERRGIERPACRAEGKRGHQEENGCNNKRGKVAGGEEAVPGLAKLPRPAGQG